MFEMTMGKCRCGHIDVEHKLEFLPDFTPAGAGECRVCKCTQFGVGKLVAPETEPEVVVLEGIPSAAFIEKMIDDPNFHAAVNQFVIVSRVSRFTELMSVVRGSPEHRYSRAAMAEQIFEDISLSYSLNPPKGIADKIVKLRALGALRVSYWVDMFYGRLHAIRTGAIENEEEETGEI